MHIPGMLRHFDPLADKIMCDHCHNKYPLSLYYFQEYKADVTEAEVERVQGCRSAKEAPTTSNGGVIRKGVAE